MRFPAFVIGSVVIAHSGLSVASPIANCQVRLSQYEKELADANGKTERFEALASAAHAAFLCGDKDKSLKYGNESLALAEKYRSSWNYGNAIHYGHLILGHAAIARGELTTAIAELHAAGDTPGSPQLNSFGPNMSLALALLERGKRADVLAYLEQCRRFWKVGSGQLDKWKSDIEVGSTPDFLANLVY